VTAALPYPDVVRDLFARQTRRGMKLGLDRVRSLLDALGAPDRAFRSLLVAGTNGKGSTCVVAADLCRAAGLRTARYTSPHLCRFTERIQVDGAEIDPDRVPGLYHRALEAAGRVGVDPTFFELTTAMALCAFAQDGVEVAILEVGLGGRLDATNATEPDVSIITPVDMDHVALLGPTQAHIAREKAGVLRPGRPAWSAPQSAVVREVLHAEARRLGSRLEFLEPADAYPGPLGLEGEHQRLNAALALRAVAGMGVRLDEETVARVLGSTRWPGRYEWLVVLPPGEAPRPGWPQGTSPPQSARRPGLPLPTYVERGPSPLKSWGGEAPAGTPSTSLLTGPGERARVLLDGAHNPHAARVLGRMMARDPRITGAARRVWVVGASGGRDVRALADEVLGQGAPGPDHVVATQAGVPAAVAVGEVAARWPGARVVVPVAEAVALALQLAGPDGVVVVWGSLYAVGEARAALTGEPRDVVALGG
jgi:dihydrofolate synthase/folylpolyglutamate synthase